MIRYFTEAKEELRKVAWPTRDQAIMYSGFVLGISIFMAAYFGALDWLLTIGLEALLKITG